MTADLAMLANLGQGWLVLAFAVFLRVGAAMALFPAFGERSVPERVRLVLALAFTLIVLPAVAPALRPALAQMEMPGILLLTEAVAGLAIGAVIRLFVLVLQMAGSMAAQATSLAQIFGGQNADPQPAIGHVLLVGGLALAVMLDLHVRLAGVLILSYEVFPPGALPGAEILSAWGLARVAQAFALAFTLAAPFVVASLVYNVALGVINRAMPQLMVAFVGAPAITAGGLILLFLTAPILLSVWGEGLLRLLADPFGGG
ncbi:flagellar biosynthetic protein FliR [Sinisalibacter aestuarii]|uniref:Flagellar biosynthesis protein FliR n=1 Tax=Sinisalibacter aestuarii TaxID=2949426 RepID=A0ABQ5LNW0_9RHOB|nr:flagellar biosynthetic protein FliR [Sinisalibacter aestuarii]GKY86682.1 flagellar biosynthesis protein FliR [Sinisalibacter aestuarii]